MKKQLPILLILILMLMSFGAIGQGVDQQWVLNNPNANANKYKFENCTAVDASILNARNDLFIVYDDNSYFNSRDLQNWRMSTQGQSTVVPDNPILDFLKTPNYIYWTNVYEGDGNGPPPNAISIAGNSNFTIPPNGVLEELNVNHDVVGRKDITVIIDGTLGTETCDCWDYELLFNDCIGANCNGLLSLQNSIFPSNYYTGSVSSNTVVVTPQNCYAYVNFRVRDDVYDLAVAKKKTRFTLIKSLKDSMVINERCKNEQANNGPITLDVAIRNSHDPNYIQLMGICDLNNDTNGSTYLNYYMQVQNTGTLAESNGITMEMPFPPHLDLSSVYVQELMFGNNIVVPNNPQPGQLSATSTIVNNKIVFEFINGFLPALGLDERASTVSARFCIKVSDSFNGDIQNNANDVFVLDSNDNTLGTSYFGTKDYDIYTNYDLPIQKEGTNRISPDCTCSDEFLISSSCPFYKITCYGSINPIAIGLYGLLILLALIGMKQFTGSKD